MESPTIVKIYSNENVEVVWCKRTGKVRVKPHGEWAYPEETDTRVELCLYLCSHLSTDQLQDLSRKQYRLDPVPNA